MKKTLRILIVLIAILTITATPVLADKPSNFDEEGNTLSTVSDNGFDQWGYNRTARIFSGTGLSWCLGKGYSQSYCESAYGLWLNDKLVMKWNAEWDRGNAENWANPPYDAWLNNQWNGAGQNGSGEVWHYKIVWYGSCGADYTPLPNGGYCIWGQFATIMDQGTSDGEHYWFAHGLPTGYGTYP
jgi:hypothetical protein